jgi:hypothetical protein
MFLREGRILWEGIAKHLVRNVHLFSEVFRVCVSGLLFSTRPVELVNQLDRDPAGKIWLCFSVNRYIFVLNEDDGSISRYSRPAPEPLSSASLCAINLILG